MANELLLINPRRRRRKATRKRRRRNPNARRTASRQVMARSGLTRRANPKRRMMRQGRYARPAARRVTRRYRRNPNGGRMTMRNVVNNVVIPAAQAGAGALALDILWGYVPVPLEWKTGNLRHVVKGGGAIVLGMLAENLLGQRIGRNIALGALTVTFHDAMRDMVAQFAPQIPLGYVGAGYAAGQYGGPMTYDYPAGGTTQSSAGMGMYVGRGAPAPQVVPMPSKRENENMGYYTTS